MPWSSFENTPRESKCNGSMFHSVYQVKSKGYEFHWHLPRQRNDHGEGNWPSDLLSYTAHPTAITWSSFLPSWDLQPSLPLTGAVWFLSLSLLSHCQYLPHCSVVRLVNTSVSFFIWSYMALLWMHSPRDSDRLHFRFFRLGSQNLPTIRLLGRPTFPATTTA